MNQPMHPDASELMELTLHHHINWLNRWHEAEGDDYRVTRASYDECNDSPTILAITPLNAFPTVQLTIRCSPYHDEGGHSILIAILRDWTTIAAPKSMWICDTVIQYFDTDAHIIYADNDYQGLPNP